MKTRMMWLAGLLMLNIFSLSAQDLFDKLGESEHISTVYISKAMMNMFANLSTDKAHVQGVDIKKISSKLDQLDIYSSEDAEGMQLIRQEGKKLSANSRDYVMLMRVKDKGDNVLFYGIPDKESSKYRALVMFVDNKDECVLIRLLGLFSQTDIQSLTESR